MTASGSPLTVDVFTVKTALTAERPTTRPRPICENADYAAFARRILGAHGRRIARGDIEGLASLIGLADEIDTAIRTAVDGLRGIGYSWAEIAARLGTTRQAAQQRFGASR